MKSEFQTSAVVMTTDTHRYGNIWMMKQQEGGVKEGKKEERHENNWSEASGGEEMKRWRR